MKLFGVEAGDRGVGVEARARSRLVTKKQKATAKAVARNALFFIPRIRNSDGLNRIIFGLPLFSRNQCAHLQ